MEQFDGSGRLPNFFIVGAPKAGTTSLYSYLRQHPQVCMSPVKEPCYFASEVRPEGFSTEFRPAALKRSEQLREYLNRPGPGPHPEGIVANWEDYLRLFRNAKDEPAIGEASVCYLWSATAAANIRSRIPGAKIIMVLRDPAERAFSQYLHNAADGVVRGSFREQIELGARGGRQEFRPLYPFLENGLYHQQVKRFLDAFPRANVRIYLYEDAWRDPLALLTSMFDFLGIDSDFKADLSRRELERRGPRSLTANYVLRKSHARERLQAAIPDGLKSRLRSLLYKPPGSLAMEARDREFLRDFYREDVTKLASLLNRDLESWLD